MEINEDRLMTMRREQDVYFARMQEYACVVSERDDLKAEIVILKKFIGEDCVCPDLYDQYSAPHDEALCSWCIKAKSLQSLDSEPSEQDASAERVWELNELRAQIAALFCQREAAGRKIANLEHALNDLRLANIYPTPSPFHPEKEINPADIDFRYPLGDVRRYKAALINNRAENDKLNRVIQQVKDGWNMAPNLRPEQKQP